MSLINVSKSTELFYSKLAAFYHLIDMILRRHKHILFEEINKLPKGNLLEIGVGNGSNLHFYNIHKVIGIDTSAKMVHLAKKQINNKAAIQQMNGEELKFNEESFDYVVLSHVIAVVDDPEKVIKEVYRVLKPKGKVFILNHFTPENWLQYLDKSAGIFSKLLHFKSVFYLKDIQSLKCFLPVRIIDIGCLSYFKLVIMEKE